MRETVRTGKTVILPKRDARPADRAEKDGQKPERPAKEKEVAKNDTDQ